jgi:hypothetical protein
MGGTEAELALLLILTLVKDIGVKMYSECTKNSLAMKEFIPLKVLGIGFRLDLGCLLVSPKRLLTLRSQDEKSDKT